MKCARCLLQLQCLRLLGQSARSAAQYGALLQSTSSSQPNMLHNTQHQVLRRFHGSPACAKDRPVPAEFMNEDDKKRDRSLVIHDDLFEQVAKGAKTKATFNKVVDMFLKRDVRRRGHVEFIYAALRKMPEFGVEKDLAVYNKLLDVFPKEVFVPRNFIQRMFNHYPRQQECGVQILEQMENYGIMPNVETKVLLVQIFGEKGHPMRKYQRIMYWFPKFKHISPFPVPHQLPEDPVDLARFSLKRIASDLDAQVTVYQLPCTDITESGEEITLPYIVGIQSPSQMELLAKHNPSRPVFVEGPFPLWLRKTCVYYYILRADPIPAEEKVEEPYDPERCLDYPLQLDLDLDVDLGDDESFDVEDLDEGPVFAMCMTSQGDQAVLNQWISGLQENNPILGQVPTLFRLDAGPKQLQTAADTESAHHHKTEPESQREERQPEEEPEVTVEEEPRRSQRMK
ncbi:evolutionarily conserved signaling intermediate in Toll pathway, mitochondrial [Epinephelus fuscoguttatus]|uniref:evolutionarily conserved signaling intermediate in Toll pathway, mitochondrial n=1 Tax=Epinephelus fuscoguttatus TaxID=293821 RepID=UPI0020D19A6B|nr:evolutionarily conserved signaling intermediate in Toll pathway, mitochondrial [Epinephelus fuscoguttatus]XP_049423759.1 evolutionarily conserved signaling intermediate in Toll pathway, mitochondrial [Epinephelus fuscoguttatus]XP_049423760.1 evolutionarily conserved signaling intermediate in Toll pathway, mitochondrial [Epinephelus fuscoguttatus]